MRFILCAILAFSWVRPASAWVNGELSIWMDADRMPAMHRWFYIVSLVKSQSVSFGRN